MIQPHAIQSNTADVLNKILFQFTLDEMQEQGVNLSDLQNKGEIEAFLNQNAAASATEITLRWGEESPE
jgi:hypothetical protein